MNKFTCILSMVMIFCLQSGAASLYKPNVYLSIDGGATRSYFVSNGLTRNFFEPTSQPVRSTRPTGTFSADIAFCDYFGIAASIGFCHNGQSSEPTTVTLSDDIFEHDFTSAIKLDYLITPLVLKTGIHRKWYSVFLRTGIVPSLLVNKEIVWKIDGIAQETDSRYLPPYYISWWDLPLHVGGEAGVHFGTNSIFIIGQYNYSFHDVEQNFSGHAYARSYGISLQLRHLIY